MARNCYNCKYHDTDYEWDDELEDEICIDRCLKKHRFYLNTSLLNCPYFKKFIPKPYIEKDTKCDSCKFVEDCNNRGYVLESTIILDSRRHYIKGRGCYCQKESGALDDKKLSEIIKLGEKAHISADMTEILDKTIQKYGDITLGEFYTSEEIRDWVFDLGNWR